MPTIRQVRVIVLGVVATDQRPSRIIALIFTGTVKEVAVKEQRVSRFHFAVNQFVTFGCLGDSNWIGPFLIPSGRMFYPANRVGTTENL